MASAARAAGSAARRTTHGELRRFPLLVMPLQSAAAPISESTRSSRKAFRSGGFGSASRNAATATVASSTWVACFAVPVTNASPQEESLRIFIEAAPVQRDLHLTNPRADLGEHPCRLDEPGRQSAHAPAR
jgi:hypothetical protein